MKTNVTSDRFRITSYLQKLSMWFGQIALAISTFSKIQAQSIWETFGVDIVHDQIDMTKLPHQFGELFNLAKKRYKHQRFLTHSLSKM